MGYGILLKITIFVFISHLAYLISKSLSDGAAAAYRLLGKRKKNKLLTGIAVTRPRCERNRV
jgi:hypothetical protein